MKSILISLGLFLLGAAIFGAISTALSQSGNSFSALGAMVVFALCMLPLAGYRASRNALHKREEREENDREWEEAHKK